MEKNINITIKNKEEVVNMKIIAIALVAALCVVSYTSAEAAADKTVSVTASGSIAAVTSLAVTPSSITFGTTNADAYPTTPADSKIKIDYSSNYNPWKIRVYTNNVQVTNYDPLTKKGIIAKGGLANGSSGTPGSGTAVVPCKWVAKVGTSSSAPTLSVYKAAANFVKDLRDQDDPITATEDESYAAADAAGYTNVAYGGPAGGFCVDPLNLTKDHEYEGDAITPTTGIAVYMIGLWGTSGMTPAIPASAGSYSTTFVFDLYHE